MSFRSRKPPSTSAPCSPVSSTTPSRRRSKASQGLKGRGFQHTTSFRAVTDALRRSCRFYRCWRSASALGRCGRSWNSSQSTWSWRQGALGRVFAWAAIYANEEFARRAVSALATEVETYLRLQPAGPSSWDLKKPLIISKSPGEPVQEDHHTSSAELTRAAAGCPVGRAVRGRIQVGSSREGLQGTPSLIGVKDPALIRDPLLQ
jgi:hypothetical protein